MKKHTYMLIALFLFLTGFGCDGKRTTEKKPQTSTLAVDTSRNLPYPAGGKLVDPDSLAKPKTVPILRKSKAVPARNNVFVTKPPTPIPFTNTPEIITPGENGVPLPDTISMLQEVTTVRHPRPIVAGPLTMKPEAIADIQYLSVSQGLKYPFVSSLLEDRRGNLWIKNGDYLSRYDGQHFIHYSSSDGIVMAGGGIGGGIVSMLEDRRGNLWLGGWGGLSRYDGNHYTRYTFAEGSKGFSVMSTAEDQDGKLWFGTYNGVICYDPSTNSGRGGFVRFTRREGLLGRSVRTILQDHKGSLWFGTGDGLSRFDGQRFTNFPVKGENGGVRNIIEDGQGVFWLGTDDGLIRFDPMAYAGRGSFANINLEVGNVRALAEDDKGNIWVTSYREGLFCLLRNETGVGNSYVRYTQNEGLNGNYFRAMIKDSHGNIWIGGQNGGLSRINKQNPIRYYNQAIGLKGNNVDCIIEDSRGSLWFGLTNAAGALRYDDLDGGTFTNYGTTEGLVDPSVTSIMEDQMGNIWMGSWGPESGNGALRLNRSTKPLKSNLSYPGRESFTYFNTETGLLDRPVISIFQDSRGNLWFGNVTGVTCFEPDHFGGSPGRIFHYPLKDGSVAGVGRDIIEDRHGDIWFASHGRGVYKLNLNLLAYKTEESSPATAPNSLEKIDTRDWIEGQTFTNYTTQDGLSDNRVHDIMEDSRGMLWFASANGLSRFDPTEQQFYTYGPEDGLLSDNLLAMAEDRQNNLWILSQSGMNVVVSDQKNEADSSEGGNYQFFTFSAPDGFRTIDSGFKSILVTRQNQLWWATGDGAASLDLNNFELPVASPKINLNSIEIEQSYIDFLGFQESDYRKRSPLIERLAGTFDSVAAFNNYPLNLALPYDINHLTFQFSAIDWTSPHQLRYSYTMEGLDKTWSEGSPETTADYRNLAPGDYMFKVKALGIANKWSEVFSYPFTIRPPWWLTWSAYAFYSLCFIGGVIAVDRFQRRRLIEQERQKSRDKELEQAKEIEKAYTDLKATQSQLIQSEKMASLGELTAGIAHEIQNPLNFVNNFSEVNEELIEELEARSSKLKAYLPKGKGEEDINEIEELFRDLRDNEGKIRHHGQRADSIVKGMLQHSRSSNGKKEPTDINALADEYLRLAYHGLRAKDKSFNADFSTDLDETLPKINVIPQDIGRVLLNLINNAFQAVSSKASTSEDTDYKPEVALSTKLLSPWTGGPQGVDTGIQISIKDNGSGIPDDIKDKIFQPFFTTKPTGQGTGLGLSLSYDIVKAHGGELKLEADEGEGTEFTIKLPIV